MFSFRWKSWTAVDTKRVKILYIHIYKFISVRDSSTKLQKKFLFQDILVEKSNIQEEVKYISWRENIEMRLNSFTYRVREKAVFKSYSNRIWRLYLQF